MKHNKLGKSEIKVSALTVGCWAFGGGAYWGEQSQRDVDAVVRAALDAEVNTFDTAEMYNDGASEQSLGEALKGDSMRSKAVVISKIFPSNCREVRKHCTDSLKRLSMDYLDCYMLHWPVQPAAVADGLPDNAEIIQQLGELKQEGLIRSVGVSNFGVGQLKEVLATGVQIDVNEIAYNIVSRAIEAEIAPFCMDNGISIIGAMGLQQGVLADLYKTADEVPDNQAHSRHFAQERGGGTSRHHEAGAEKEIFEALDALRHIAAEMNVPVAQLSIAWLLKKPFMASTLVGSRTYAELKTNIEACSLEVSDEIERRIDEISLPVWKVLGNSPDYYENRSKSRIY
jgi:aryl-alcohol dehydrogenase-like predicted oxidoreductase